MFLLLFEVFLSLFQLPLLSDPSVRHLAVQFKLHQLFALLITLLSTLLLFVVKKSVKFDDSIPFIILGLSTFSYLGENFLVLGLLRGRYR